MTLKTNENWRKLTCYAIVAKKLQGWQIEIEGQDVLDLCHDAGRAEELEEENAELRSVVDRYNRRSESGECIGDYLDALEHNQDLVKEITDLRAKLDEAYERAAQVCEQEICNCCWTEESQVAIEQVVSTIRALKGQEEKV